MNWLVFVYGVNSGQVVETSLGYFINPLVSVLLGVVVFSERLRPLQWTAVGIAAVRGRGPDDRLRPPAVDRAGAGRQLRSVRGDEEGGPGGGGPGLFVETALVAVPAGIVLAVLHSSGHGTFANAGRATHCS